MVEKPVLAQAPGTVRDNLGSLRCGPRQVSRHLVGAAGLESHPAEGARTRLEDQSADHGLNSESASHHELRKETCLLGAPPRGRGRLHDLLTAQKLRSRGRDRIQAAGLAGLHRFHAEIHEACVGVQDKSPDRGRSVVTPLVHPGQGAGSVSRGRGNAPPPCRIPAAVAADCRPPNRAWSRLESRAVGAELADRRTPDRPGSECVAVHARPRSDPGPAPLASYQVALRRSPAALQAISRTRSLVSRNLAHPLTNALVA